MLADPYRPCKGCGETKFLQPDPAGYHYDATTESGAPLLCTNSLCARAQASGAAK